jgi:microcystin-dependent protein
MTTRSGSQSPTFTAVTPEPIATASSAQASTWSSYANGFYEFPPTYNIVWENPIPINNLSKYLTSIPPKDAKKIVNLLEDNAKSLEDHLDSGYLKTSGGTIAGNTTFGAPVNFYSGVNLGQQSLYSMLPPVGSIMPYAGNKSPLGWLVCDGSEYSYTLYPNLYNVIGSTYDTSTGLPAPAAGNFRVPNLKGRMPVGLDAGITDFNTRGKSGGSTTVTITVAQMPVHKHENTAALTSGTVSITDTGHVHLQNEASTGGLLANAADSNVDYTYFHTGAGRFNTNSAYTGISASVGTAVTVTNVDAGSGNAVDNMSPYLVLNYIIKT